MTKPVNRAHLRTGRPTTFRQKTADELLQRVAAGELILNICADEHMPAWSTLCGWKRRNPEFAAAYARAREMSAEWLEEQALEAAVLRSTVE